jgi:hypothetical protein
MRAELANADKIPLVFAVDQRPFKFQKDTGPVNRFCVLYPLMTVSGERLKADRESFPHRGRVWWKLRDDIREDLVVPGSLWTGTLEPARGSGRGRADDDVYQVCLRDVYPAGGELVEILTVKEDDPDLGRILKETPLAWPEPVTPRVILQGWRTMLGPLRATWRPETQDLVFAPLSAAQPEVLRVPVKDFFENTRTERFQIDLNAFDPQSEQLRRAILLTRMDWLNLDRLRKVGEVLDCSTDSQVVNWALGYLGLSRSQATPIKQVLAEVQQRQVSFNGETEARKLDRFQHIAQDAERIVNLGAEVARQLAETPAFGDLVSRHVETAAERRIAEIVARRQQEIDTAVQAKKRELEQVQANLDQLAAEYDRRAAAHEEELRKRVAGRITALEERERQADLRQRFLDGQQEEFLGRFRKEANDAAAAVLAQLPLLRALGLAGDSPGGSGPATAAGFVDLPLPAFLQEKRTRPGDPAITEEEFLDQLGRVVEQKGFRFATDDLINYHVCLKTGGLTVLAGPSGTGKSSLPRLYAEALGCRDEYLHVPVRPDWLDDRDLIGAFNALAQRFEPAGSGLVEHLIAASIDQREGRGGIFVVCLDEMNLARVEHYFAQFLSLLELPIEERALTLFAPGLVRPGDPYAPFQRMRLGDNVRFVGTVNIDETTHFFSPKMLDRCQVVAFAAPDLATPRRTRAAERVHGLRPVTWATYCEWVRPPRAEGSARAQLLEVNETLRPAHLGLGYRQFDRVLRYVESARPFLSEDAALDYQLKQVVLPRLRPTAPHFAETVQALTRLVARDRFPRSADILARILEARAEDDYFQLL